MRQIQQSEAGTCCWASYCCFLPFQVGLEILSRKSFHNLPQTRKSKNRKKEAERPREPELKRMGLFNCSLSSESVQLKLFSFNSFIYSCYFETCSKVLVKIHNGEFPKIKIKTWQEISLNTTTQLYSERKCFKQA